MFFEGVPQASISYLNGSYDSVFYEIADEYKTHIFNSNLKSNP